MTGTKYRVIRECAQELDWEITDDKYDDSSLKERRKNQIADLCWYDLPIDSSKLSQMKRYQRVNHFPAMHGITRKSSLATILKKKKDNFSQDYHFFPKSWNLPL